MNHNSTEGGRPERPSDWNDGGPFYLSEPGQLTIHTGMKWSCQLNEDFVSAESCLREKVVFVRFRRQRDSGVSGDSWNKTRANSVSVRQEVRRTRPGTHLRSSQDPRFGRKCRSTKKGRAMRLCLVVFFDPF
jgi:hypothetical protein